MILTPRFCSQNLCFCFFTFNRSSIFCSVGFGLEIRLQTELSPLHLSRDSRSMLTDVSRSCHETANSSLLRNRRTNARRIATWRHGIQKDARRKGQASRSFRGASPHHGVKSRTRQDSFKAATWWYRALWQRRRWLLWCRWAKVWINRKKHLSEVMTIVFLLKAEQIKMHNMSVTWFQQWNQGFCPAVKKKRQKRLEDKPKLEKAWNLLTEVMRRTSDSSNCKQWCVTWTIRQQIKIVF